MSGGEMRKVKLIAAMVQDHDVDEVLGALIEKGYRATKLSTTGGFLRYSNWMVLVGIEHKDGEDKVADVLRVIEKRCHTRKQLVLPPGAPAEAEPIEVEVGGAIVFIWDAEYVRL